MVKSVILNPCVKSLRNWKGPNRALEPFLGCPGRLSPTRGSNAQPRADYEVLSGSVGHGLGTVTGWVGVPVNLSHKASIFFWASRTAWSFTGSISFFIL